MSEFATGDIITTKKKHPCGGDKWRIIRVGADIKLKCLTCDRIVMFERADFVKRYKKTLEKAAQSANGEE